VLLTYGRAIALIPVLIVLYFAAIAAFFVAWIMQFAVLFVPAFPVPCRPPEVPDEVSCHGVVRQAGSVLQLIRQSSVAS